MTYSTLDIIIIAICGIFLLIAYIYGKATGTMWYGIRWDNIFRGIGKFFRWLFK